MHGAEKGLEMACKTQTFRRFIFALISCGAYSHKPKWKSVV